MKANERDSNIANYSAVATTTVTESQHVDFAVSASGPSEATAGDLATYAFTVTNQTPAGQPAAGVTLINQMPDGMELLAARSSIPCRASTAFRNATCQRVMSPGETFWVEATVRVVRAGALVNSAQLSPSYELAEMDPSDNSAQVVTDDRPTAISALATPSADLKLYAWTDAVVIAPNETLTYQYFGYNMGPSTAANVRLTAEIPPNSTFVSATNTQGPCTTVGTTVSCELGDLSPGTVVTPITVRGLVNGSSPSASVSPATRLTGSRTTIPGPVGTGSTTRDSQRSLLASSRRCGGQSPAPLLVTVEPEPLSKSEQFDTIETAR